jgi:predicted NUDIX family phosphoesterase
MPDKVERVLVVEASWVHSLHATKGFLPEIHPDFFPNLPARAFFLDRAVAEQNPTFRQVIPYVLVRHNGMYLTVTRHRTQGEPRLHDKMSIGIGGHIDPGDSEEADILDAGLRRELSEELATDDPPGWDDLPSLGLIVDDGDDVSRVHLGIVLRWDTADPVSVRETDKMHGEYLTPAAIGAARERLENWSRLVYDGLIAPAARRVNLSASPDLSVPREARSS